MIDGLGWIGLLLGGCALVYLSGACLALLFWTRRRPASRCDTMPSTAPITILKPLAGMEPELYENLRSFCTQQYTEYQVIFGTQALDDPALAVARRLQREFPRLDIQVVAGDHIPCINRKIGNLVHMMKFAGFEYLVASDSSTRVGPQYLNELAADLTNPDVGVVTCLYRGKSDRSIWSRLGALYMNEWFTPSILLGWMLGLRDFGFGSTLALRRTALDAIGGFEVLKDQLADDYMLAQLLRQRGLKTVLSHYLVDTTVHEAAFSTLWQHELRWVRAVCILQPVGHALSLITHTVPMALLAALLAHSQPWAWIMPCAALALRFAMHAIATQAEKRDATRDAIKAVPEDSARCGVLLFIALLPLRETISFAVWLSSYFGRHVHWRGRTFSVRQNGNMEEV